MELLRSLRRSQDQEVQHANDRLLQHALVLGGLRPALADQVRDLMITSEPSNHTAKNRPADLRSVRRDLAAHLRDKLLQEVHERFLRLGEVYGRKELEEREEEVLHEGLEVLRREVHVVDHELERICGETENEHSVRTSLQKGAYTVQSEGVSRERTHGGEADDEISGWG